MNGAQNERRFCSNFSCKTSNLDARAIISVTIVNKSARHTKKIVVKTLEFKVIIL